jgi:hypothetical protein
MFNSQIILRLIITLPSVGLKEFHFVYKIPEGIGDIEGDKVLMQWRYITANSCQPPGYKNSTIGSWLDEKGWLRSGGNLYDCKDVHLYDRAGNRDEDTPEQVCFFMFRHMS